MLRTLCAMHSEKGMYNAHPPTRAAFAPRHRRLRPDSGRTSCPTGILPQSDKTPAGPTPDCGGIAAAIAAAEFQGRSDCSSTL